MNSGDSFMWGLTIGLGSTFLFCWAFYRTGVMDGARAILNPEDPLYDKLRQKLIDWGVL